MRFESLALSWFIVKVLVTPQRLHFFEMLTPICFESSVRVPARTFRLKWLWQLLQTPYTIIG